MPKTDQRVIVFGGTREGRQLFEYLQKNGVFCILSVATDYGWEMAGGSDQVTSGRMDREQMRLLLKEQGFTLVVDATHPYARIVSENIQAACEAEHIPRLRLIRKVDRLEGVRYFGSHEEVVAVLNQIRGNIFLTIGSKELAHYTRVQDFPERVYARILPMQESLQHALDLGFQNGKLICMQGSFTKEMNLACFQMTRAACMVTKDSGSVGGMAAKVQAAQEMGIPCLVLAREEEQGYTFEEMIRELGSRLSILNRRFPVFLDLGQGKVTVVGGGAIAERRVQQLLQFHAVIQVISPELTLKLRELADQGSIMWEEKAYYAGALQDAILVLAATNSRTVNHQVHLEAAEKGILASIADAREESSFWFPAIIEKDDLTAGLISQEGNHRKVRETAEQIRRDIGVI